MKGCTLRRADKSQKERHFENALERVGTTGAFFRSLARSRSRSGAVILIDFHTSDQM